MRIAMPANLNRQCGTEEINAPITENFLRSMSAETFTLSFLFSNLNTLPIDYRSTETLAP